VILQMTSLGLGDVSGFPFVDPPDRRQVAAGVQLLEELHALDTSQVGGRRLTKVGRRLAALPVDPRLGRMIIEADRLGVLREVLVIAAALSVQDPRERPVEHRARADQLHARFRDPRSDFLTFLNLWRHVRAEQRERSSSAFRRMCRDEHLNYLRIREWQELHTQLRTAAKQLGLTSKGREVAEADATDEDGVHQALLSGLLSHLGLRDAEKRDYLGARGTRFSLFPGSGLFKKPPEYVMAAELVETSRLYARVNAAIRPEWAERLAAHLVKRSYAEPHWSRRRAAVLARERVTLYGVPLVADRLVSYGKVDPALSRELFIRHALVYGEWRTDHRFFARNRALLEEAEELENRARRRGIVVDEHTLFDFYDARIGQDVVSGAHFDSWWKKVRHRQPDLLTFDPAMLVRGADDVSAQDYPDTWEEQGLALPLRYSFEPGSAEDGVTVDLPLGTLNQVPDDVLSWQVPGLREELVVALLRSLPKQLRVSFVPAPDVAREFLAVVPAGAEPLLDALERHLRSRTGVVVPRDAWDWSKVPPHLRPTYRILGDAGKVLATDKVLARLKGPLAGRFAEALTDAAAAYERTGQTRWTFGEVEVSFEQVRAGHRVRGYPGLVDEGSSVGLRAFATEEEQETAHALGVRRLLALTVPSPAGRLTEGWDNRRKLTLAGSPYTTVAALLDDCVLAAAGALVERHGAPVRDEQAFEQLREAAVAHLEGTSREVLDDTVRVLEAWRETDRVLTGSVDLRMLPAMTDMRAQVGRLVRRGFVGDVGAQRLRHLPRYLTGVRLRHEKLLAGGPERDHRLMDQVTPLQEAYLHRVAALPDGQPEPQPLRAVRWLLEEYRVSLWAQQLGTPQPVSDARIRKALAAA
jgi:ATP-dependent helicase HrpA